MKHIEAEDLKIYREAVKIGEECWQLYKKFGWQTKKIVGDQLITSADSIGANIAEGYGRFHYLDKIKFFYNARGSLLETLYWLKILKNRELIDKIRSDTISQELKKLNFSLNSFIKSIYESRKQTKI